MNEDQKRELTERIVKWMGIEFIKCQSVNGPGRNIFGEIIDDGTYLSVRDPQGRLAKKPFPTSFKPLTSRDDWARVEDKIERRGLTERYIDALRDKLDAPYYELQNEMSEVYYRHLLKIRRATPLVCAQALIEVLNETNKPN